ncbi:two-partner secretion domain-containing protein [Fischerella sp. PCC 9605]|uniref:two-partner secretion domain-containing protein n=1 Tax=Fischerella sp. PCC 9605 TaxID=1173024 RepID=UPI0004B14851|nr:S-layer family protein [Fischerella sp. PCC 9605]
MLLKNSEYIWNLDNNYLTNNKRSRIYRQQAFVKVWRSLFFITLSIAILGSLTAIKSARAQLPSIAADGSLSTTVSSPDGSNFTIENGNRTGVNLFHSFSRFSVPNNGSAVFQNPSDVQNVISRVTGGSLSNIDGLLKTQGSANLFLLNPAGILFGKNARLDVGSFFATTADSFIFDNGFEFSASNPQAPPALTINIPIGLRFRDNPVNITNQSIAKDINGNLVGLQVPSGKNLALVGGNVRLDGSGIKAPGGRVELGGLAVAGTVGLNPDGSLSFPNGIKRADVSLANESFVDVTAGGGGSIAVNARNLELLGGSALYAGISPGSGSVGSQAGDITVNATGQTTVTNNSLISNFVGSGAVGNSGNITIETGQLNISDGSQIVTLTTGQGNAGNLTINASDSVELNGEGQDITLLTSQVRPRGRGNAGDLTIKTQRLSVKNGAQIFTGTFGEGNAGNLTIRASESVEMGGRGRYVNGLFTTVEPRAKGTGGNLTIETGRLSIRDGSYVSTSTFSEGDAGNILIDASELVEVVGTARPGGASFLVANTLERATGDGGDLNIKTKKLVVRNAQVSTTAFGKGNAGNLTVRASESVEVSGKVVTRRSGREIVNSAGLFAQVNPTGEGNGGNIVIETPYLSVSDGARVQVATFGQGNAGNLLIRAVDIDVSEASTGIFAGVRADEDEARVLPRGNGGTVTIETNRLRVRDGARVSTTTEGEGNAGILQIRADEVEVYGTSQNGKFTSEISAAATPQSTGNGGSLRINTGKLIVRDKGTVTVRSEGSGQAGNLEITARSIKLDNQGSLTATTTSGNGGNITLNVRDYLLMRRNSTISTSAGTALTGGNGGNIFINNLPNYRGFVIATPSENSDITANAFRGQGGQVTINSYGIYGFVPRSRTELQQLLNTTDPAQLDPSKLLTNDITAISQQNPSLSGTVTLNTLDVDPSQGLTELPENVADASDKIAQNPCQRGVGSTFVITGRGGLPSNPNQTLNNNNARVDLVEPATTRSNAQSATINQPKIRPTAKQIVPAQGWVLNDKGEVVLTAYDPTATNLTQRSLEKTAACPAPF